MICEFLHNTAKMFVLRTKKTKTISSKLLVNKLNCPLSSFNCLQGQLITSHLCDANSAEVFCEVQETGMQAECNRVVPTFAQPLLL